MIIIAWNWQSKPVSRLERQIDFLCRLPETRQQAKTHLADIFRITGQFGLQGANRVKRRQTVAPAWLVVTSQEKLEEVVAALDSKRVELAKLQDRFRNRVDLAPAGP